MRNEGYFSRPFGRTGHTTSAADMEIDKSQNAKFLLEILVLHILKCYNKNIESRCKRFISNLMLYYLCRRLLRVVDGLLLCILLRSNSIFQSVLTH